MSKIHTHKVRYQSFEAEGEPAALGLVDILSRPDTANGRAHRILIPQEWMAISDLPLDSNDLCICSLFLEDPSLGEDGSIITVSTPLAGPTEPEALIRRLAAFENYEVDELHRENPNDIRAFCSSESRISLLRVIRDNKGSLVFSATVPADRFDELEDTFHYALVSVESED